MHLFALENYIGYLQNFITKCDVWALNHDRLS